MTVISLIKPMGIFSLSPLINIRQILKQMQQQVEYPRPDSNKLQILDVIIGQCLDQIFRPRRIGIYIAEVRNLVIKVLSIDLKTLSLQLHNNIRDIVLVIFQMN
ncbi:hypothetical protein BG74_03610 [Sodalis-like endosymbiont of Proechinophthirus fluctus]|nr:hypothetical protein BG74_03610 [Sodalis-like endosymbiont of Proechinophthirus fluctus]